MRLVVRLLSGAELLGLDDVDLDRTVGSVVVETLLEACKEAKRAGAPDVARVEMAHAGAPLRNETRLWWLLLDAEAAQACLDEHQAMIVDLRAQIDQKLLESEAAKNRKKGNAHAREADRLQAEIAALEASDEHTDALRVLNGDRPLHGFFGRQPAPDEIELAAVMRPAIALTLLLHHNLKADGSEWWVHQFDKYTPVGRRRCLMCEGRGEQPPPRETTAVKVASPGSVRCLLEASRLMHPAYTQFVFDGRPLEDLDASLGDLGICDGATIDVFLAGETDCGYHGPG